jgi:hypothetical protein
VLREEFQAAPGPSSSSTLQQQAVLGYGSMNDALEKQAAELEAKLAVKAAQFEKAQHKSKVGARLEHAVPTDLQQPSPAAAKQNRLAAAAVHSSQLCLCVAALMRP